MGKKRPIVVVSSSSDDEHGIYSRNRSASKARSKYRSSSGSRSVKSSCKRPSRTRSESRSFSNAQEEAAKFEMLSEDFGECLRDFGTVQGLACSNTKEIWVDKYKPHSFVELAVHKKKVEEVNQWLAERMRISEERFGNYTLLITGPAGVGKSAAIHLIASQLGVELCEWRTPTPTLWQEHVHNSSVYMLWHAIQVVSLHIEESSYHDYLHERIPYMSKLDEFENFIVKIGKYRLLSPSYSGGSRKNVIMLIDDLPMTNGKIAFARLSKCLTTLVRTSQVPTVILITEYHKTVSADNLTHNCEELESTLERAGAHKVAFNPLTVNSIKKTLVRICKEEQCDVSAEWIDHIARASGGDVRHAITSLQYLCLRPEDACSLPKSAVVVTESKRSAAKQNLITPKRVLGGEDFNGRPILPFGRDETLTLFHALGKFLHNKRETADVFSLGQDSLVLQEKLIRNPLKMDAPEEVLSQAHGHTRNVIDFLHENVLDFISDEAIADSWLVTSYLSDADFLVSASHPAKSCTISDMYESGNLAQSVAASIAVRGVLFGNSHPSPSRWHTIRSPRLWQIDQLARSKKSQIAAECSEDYNCSLYSTFHNSVEYASTIKWLRSKSLDIHQEPRGNFLQYNEEQEMNEEKTNEIHYLEETEEDDIEDW